ncbi:MAG: AIR carboxylase-domain-containing protein [Piptocephalis tieghemiana]|nr:MAG: AIR carboxylase-domain-containing protein [Piptocephalis tieghemiana]
MRARNGNRDFSLFLIHATNKRVGLLGGGQLGRMFAEAANRLTIPVTVLDPGALSPAKQLLSCPPTPHLAGSFKDAEAVKSLAKGVDVLTVEIEHVNVDALEQVEASGTPVRPGPSALRTIQDKFVQKEFLRFHGVPVPDFGDVPSESVLEGVAEEFGYPLILKARTLAYDGRGNAIATRPAELIPAYNRLIASSSKVYAERCVPFVKELAVMVVRSVNGEVKSYPVVETIQKDGICHLVYAPASISQEAEKEARRVSEMAISALEKGGAGVFGVELFLLEDNTVLLNEIAPRPHNSGHYTIEACETSQYENHLRAILGLPLGSTRMKVPAATMLNLLGGPGYEAAVQSAITVPGATLHLYGKAEAREGRKMGHLTIVGSSVGRCVQALEPILTHTESGTAKGVLPSGLETPKVGIIMGSDSDLPVMRKAAEVLKDFGVPFELTIVSAHRTPDRLRQYSREAVSRGLQVIIAGAGGAAHLPGMVACQTALPVIGVPVKGKALDGVDSLYSIVQMPRGIPVACVAVDNSTNAALLAIRILGQGRSGEEEGWTKKMEEYMEKMEQEVMGKVDRLSKVGWDNY